MKPAYGRDDLFGIEGACGVGQDIAGEAGAALREARQNAGLTLDEVAKATRIRRDYLLALEDGDCRQMPPKAYAVAYARTYAEYVGLDPAEVAEAMKAEYLFAEARQIKLVKHRARDRKLPRGLVGAVGVVAVTLMAMTWYGYNAPARSEASRPAPAPAPEALMRWSFEAAPPDRSVWSGLASRSAPRPTWNASAPLPAETLRPANPYFIDE